MIDKKTKIWVKTMIISKKIWGCHQKPERSFFLCGYQFPLCARCTGVFVGYLVAFMLLIFNLLIPNIICMSFLIPLILDGTAQLFFNIISNNPRRFITGILFGLGSVQLMINVCQLFIATHQ